MAARGRRGGIAVESCRSAVGFELGDDLGDGLVGILFERQAAGSLLT